MWPRRAVYPVASCPRDAHCDVRGGHTSRPDTPSTVLPPRGSGFLALLPSPLPKAAGQEHYLGSQVWEALPQQLRTERGQSWRGSRRGDGQVTETKGVPPEPGAPIPSGTEHHPPDTPNLPGEQGCSRTGPHSAHSLSKGPGGSPVQAQSKRGSRGSCAGRIRRLSRSLSSGEAMN